MPIHPLCLHLIFFVYVHTCIHTYMHTYIHTQVAVDESPVGDFDLGDVYALISGPEGSLVQLGA